jgi:hypothetical protein
MVGLNRKDHFRQSKPRASVNSVGQTGSGFLELKDSESPKGEMTSEPASGALESQTVACGSWALARVSCLGRARGMGTGQENMSWPGFAVYIATSSACPVSCACHPGK